MQDNQTDEIPREPPLQKEELRKQFPLSFKKYFAKNSRLAADRLIKNRLLYFFNQQNLAKKNLRVMIYKPFISEVPIDEILMQEKLLQLYYPIQRGNRLEARRKRYDKTVPLWKMDYIVVPGLFIDENGYRLGRGGGFYDRALRFIPRRKTVFVGYAFQTKHPVVIEPHDIPVGSVVNEWQCQNCYG